MDIVERLRPHGLMGQSAETRLRQEAADEIERLQEEHHDVRILNEQYYNENAILTDEIERLREALNFYADKRIYIGSFVDAEINWDKGAKARSALQQKESE